MAYVRMAILGDAEIVAPKLREIDQIECLAIFTDSLSALKSAIRFSRISWTICNDIHEPIACFGAAASQEKGVGYAWLLSSEELDNYARRFLAESSSYINKMKQFYPTLMNYVDVRNKKSLLWLKWLGFKIDSQPIEYGLLKLPHYKFVG